VRPDWGYPFLASLRGDPPTTFRVSGVGEKTAAKLVTPTATLTRSTRTWTIKRRSSKPPSEHEAQVRLNLQNDPVGSRRASHGVCRPTSSSARSNRGGDAQACSSCSRSGAPAIGSSGNSIAWSRWPRGRRVLVSDASSDSGATSARSPETASRPFDRAARRPRGCPHMAHVAGGIARPDCHRGGVAGAAGDRLRRSRFCGARETGGAPPAMRPGPMIELCRTTSRLSWLAGRIARSPSRASSKLSKWCSAHGRRHSAHRRSPREGAHARRSNH